MEKGLYLYGFVIMSNHLHLVAQQKDGKLSDWVRDYKKFTSKKLLKLILENPQESRKEWLKVIFKYHAEFHKRSGDLQFWTHENHTIELFRSEMIEIKMKYIHENPVRAGLVEKVEDYLYSSASNFSGMKGLIEVDYWWLGCDSQLQIGRNIRVKLQTSPSAYLNLKGVDENLHLERG